MIKNIVIRIPDDLPLPEQITRVSRKLKLKAMLRRVNLFKDGFKLIKAERNGNELVFVYGVGKGLFDPHYQRHTPAKDVGMTSLGRKG